MTKTKVQVKSSSHQAVGPISFAARGFLWLSRSVTTTTRSAYITTLPTHLPQFPPSKNGIATIIFSALSRVSSG